MSTEKDEKAAVNWAADNYTNTTSFGAYGIKKEAFLAGAAHGRKAERERIWEALPDDLNDIPSGDLKQIIFGGEGEKAE